ncbi:hypothetical protein GGF31_007744 [Allomyces arbusculus]|nr:hypothetical protein GGF31_007744 [Allomyces arbusculus]
MSATASEVGGDYAGGASSDTGTAVGSPASPTAVTAAAAAAVAGPLAFQEEPRALLTYRDDYQLWPHVQRELMPRLPLRNLTWKSMRGTRTIPLLDVRVRPFEEGMLPRTSMFTAPTPSLHLYFVHCDDAETYRQVIRGQIRAWVDLFATKRDQEWLIVYIATETKTSKFLPNMKTSVFEKIKADFGKGSDKRDRCLALRLLDADARDQDVWGEFFQRIKDGILTSFDTQVMRYDEDIQRLDAQRMMPGWNFCQFFLLKEGLANCFEAIALLDDALMQYEELEVVHDQTIHTQISSFSTFGGTERGDDHPGAHLFSSSSTKDYRQLLMSNAISVFDFRVYLIRQQLHLIRRQRRVLDLLRRTVQFLRVFETTLDANAAILPPFFTESFVLSFTDAVLRAVDELVATQRLDVEALTRVSSARLELVLLAKVHLDRLGAAFHHVRGCLAATTITSGTASTGTATPEEGHVDGANGVGAPLARRPSSVVARLSNPLAVVAISDAQAYAEQYMRLTDYGLAAASMCGKPRLAVMIKTDQAHLHFALGSWDTASFLYQGVIQTYAENGWLVIDRHLLQRQAACYRELDNTKEYLMTCLRLVASNIIHRQETSGMMLPAGESDEAAAAFDMDMDELTEQARHLDHAVVVEFMPLFQVVLPPVMFSHHDRASDKIELRGVQIDSALPVAMHVDRIAVGLVGGETNDVVFAQRQVTLHPGSNYLDLVWEKPGTSGDYVAEKVKIEVGRLIFVANLIKQGRKHTLRIDEPPNPIALHLTLPHAVQLAGNTVCLQIVSADPDLVVRHGLLSLWMLTPDQAVTAVAMAPRHAADPLIPLAPAVEGAARYPVPAFQGAAALWLTLSRPLADAKLKLVFEYHRADTDAPQTVSGIASVVGTAVPRAHAELQVVGDQHFVVVTVANDDPSPLCIDDVAIAEAVGASALMCLHRAPTVLTGGQSMAVAYLVEREPGARQVRGRVRVSHHFLREDVFRALAKKLRDVAIAHDVLLYYPILKTQWFEHIETLDWTELALTGQYAMPDVGTDSPALDAFPLPVARALHACNADFYAQVRTIFLDDVVHFSACDDDGDNVLATARVVETSLAVSIPADHVEYTLELEKPAAPVVGCAVPCKLRLKHVALPPPASSPAGGDEAASTVASVPSTPLVVHYDVEAAVGALDLGALTPQQQEWLVVGAKRGSVEIEPDSEVIVDLALIPIVSGSVTLPNIALFGASAARRLTLDATELGTINLDDETDLDDDTTTNDGTTRRSSAASSALRRLSDREFTYAPAAATPTVVTVHPETTTTVVLANDGSEVQAVGHVPDVTAEQERGRQPRSAAAAVGVVVPGAIESGSRGPALARSRSSLLDVDRSSDFTAAAAVTVGGA